MAERRTPEIKYIKGFGWAMICYGDNRICWDVSEENDMELISREEAKRKITEELDSIDHVPSWVFERLERVINSLPTVEERKEGEWIDAGWDGEKCSLCGWSIDDTFYSSQFLYCPNCGARMKGE